MPAGGAGGGRQDSHSLRSPDGSVAAVLGRRHDGKLVVLPALEGASHRRASPAGLGQNVIGASIDNL